MVKKKEIQEEVKENIQSIDYCDEMEQSYADYAMSVIAARAVPDIRDGMKPVQRRILYAMNEMHLTHDKPYKKSARIVGDTMGKYHPHGDSSIYEAMVHMEQEWNYSHPMVDGHGNFGSIEGDGPAAMRYTEARLSQVAEECILEDLKKGIVDFVPNFDETEEEPALLPVKIPNILVSGTEGIAVGMATKIPTHNLGEVIDGAVAYLSNPDITTEELMECIKGPDFATGGIISNQKDLAEIYKSGQGRIRVRAKTVIEDAPNGRHNIVITEIPYTMIGAIDKFMETVANLVRAKKAPDITDICNQSGKDGIRIVVEIKKGADPQKTLNILYKKAKLEDTFGMIMLGICDQQPKIFSLTEVFRIFADYQMELNTRKYGILLKKEEHRKEIREGLIKAYDIVDLIIEILRGSKTISQAKDCLMHGNVEGIMFREKTREKEAGKLDFTEDQASAILEMPMRRLVGLEINALRKELAECEKNIKKYQGFLSSSTKMKNQIKKELLAIKEKYAIPRKTEIGNMEAAVIEKEEIQEQEYVLLMDRFGYIKLVDIPTYSRNEESVAKDFKLSMNIKNTDKFLIFTDTGKRHLIKALDIPLAKYKEKGVPIENLCGYTSGENIIFTCTCEQIRDKMLLFANDAGFVKMVNGNIFDAVKKTIDSTKLPEGGKVISVSCPEADGASEVLIETKEGYYIRFGIDQIPEKGKAAVGVRGIRLKDGDRVTGVYTGTGESCFPHGDTEVSFSRIKLTKRDGRGVRARL